MLQSTKTATPSTLITPPVLLKPEKKSALKLRKWYIGEPCFFDRGKLAFIESEISTLRRAMF